MFQVIISERRSNGKKWRTRTRTDNLEKIVQKVFGKKYHFSANNGLNSQQPSCKDRFYGYITHYVNKANASNINYDVVIDIVPSYTRY
jgi:hypothetical protein